jgi:hypothetical protein
MVRYAFRVGRIWPGFIAYPEHILDGRHVPGSLRAVLASLPKLAYADDDSIIADLLADDFIR